jgi:hypothetical protein
METGIDCKHSERASFGYREPRAASFVRSETMKSPDPRSQPSLPSPFLRKVASITSPLIALAMLAATPRAEADDTGIDSLRFGDAASERAHGVKSERGEVIQGGLDQPARRLLSGGPLSWEGGSLEWDMKVDPARPNYLTVKLWGSDKGYQTGRLLLFAEGLQVGYRHESDYDVLNQCDDDPLAPGRFVYVTLPLPPKLTEGRERLRLKIVATGPIWFYGGDFQKYQKDFTGPSRGIYQAYTHVTNRFEPPAAERQGRAAEGGLRSTAGPEVIEKSREIVKGRLEGLLTDKGIPGSFKSRNDELLLLAEAYHTEWTPAHRDRRVLERILRIGDALAADFAKDRKFIDNEWCGAGPLGQAVMLTWQDLKVLMDDPLEIAGTKMARREAWSAMFEYSVDHWRTHRRPFTNQSMIVDAGIYGANRALELMAPERAIPPARALSFLYQSAGIEPWLGSDTADGGSEAPYGRNYKLITRKGLSRELGYVGSYGETILPFMHDLVKLTGDAKLREQLRRMQLARLPFRYPSLDGGGFRCMKLVSEIDNRTAHYPHAGSAYLSPGVREAWWMDTAALLADDPVIMGIARQSVEEGQYFPYIEGRLKDRDTLGMMRNVGQWEKVKSMPATPGRLPMTPGQPDFVFSDEENAVLALKHGDRMLFVNLYYRAERAVNRVARVFEMTPQLTRIATVLSEAEVIDSGETYTRPDWIDRIRGRGITPPGQDIHQAWAGEVMPISKRPEDATSPAYGEWGPFVGKAAFYQLRYGDYLIGVNTTEDREYTLKVPEGLERAMDLVTRKEIEVKGGVRIPALSTVVLDLGKEPER